VGGDVVLLPGYGGTAAQPVLVSLAQRLTRLGYSCHRHAVPRGRLTPDLAAQTEWLEGILDGLEGPAVLVGRSFGGRVCARVAARRPVEALVLLGFPLRPPGRLRPLDEAALAGVRCPTLVVQGDRDELGPLAVVRRVARLNPLVSVHVIEGAGHAFGRHTQGALDAAVGFIEGR
jgi:hypothetical protein